MNAVFLQVVKVTNFPKIVNISENDYQVYVKLFPKEEGSFGKLNMISHGNNKYHLTSPVTWNFQYKDALTTHIHLYFLAGKTCFADLRLPLTWFEKNSVVTYSYPARFLINFQHNKNMMVKLTIHLSENNEAAFSAPKGHLLVTPAWDKKGNKVNSQNAQTNQKGDSNSPTNQQPYYVTAQPQQVIDRPPQVITQQQQVINHPQPPMVQPQQVLNHAKSANIYPGTYHQQKLVNQNKQQKDRQAISQLPPGVNQQTQPIQQQPAMNAPPPNSLYIQSNVRPPIQGYPPLSVIPQQQTVPPSSLNPYSSSPLSAYPPMPPMPEQQTQTPQEISSTFSDDDDNDLDIPGHQPQSNESVQKVAQYEFPQIPPSIAQQPNYPYLYQQPHMGYTINPTFYQQPGYAYGYQQPVSYMYPQQTAYPSSLEQIIQQQQQIIQQQQQQILQQQQYLQNKSSQMEHIDNNHAQVEQVMAKNNEQENKIPQNELQPMPLQLPNKVFIPPSVGYQPSPEFEAQQRQQLKLAQQQQKQQELKKKKAKSAKIKKAKELDMNQNNESTSMLEKPQMVINDSNGLGFVDKDMPGAENINQNPVIVQTFDNDTNDKLSGVGNDGFSSEESLQPLAIPTETNYGLVPKKVKQPLIENKREPIPQ